MSSVIKNVWHNCMFKSNLWQKKNQICTSLFVLMAKNTLLPYYANGLTCENQQMLALILGYALQTKKQHEQRLCRNFPRNGTQHTYYSTIHFQSQNCYETPKLPFGHKLPLFLLLSHLLWTQMVLYNGNFLSKTCWVIKYFLFSLLT